MTPAELTTIRVPILPSSVRHCRRPLFLVSRYSSPLSSTLCQFCFICHAYSSQQQPCAPHTHIANFIPNVLCTPPPPYPPLSSPLLVRPPSFSLPWHTATATSLPLPRHKTHRRTEPTTRTCRQRNPADPSTLITSPFPAPTLSYFPTAPTRLPVPSFPKNSPQTPRPLPPLSYPRL